MKQSRGNYFEIVSLYAIAATGPDHPPALRLGGEATEVTKAVVIMTGGGRLLTCTGLRTATVGASVTAVGIRDPDLQTIIGTKEGRDPPPQHDTLDRRPLTRVWSLTQVILFLF